MAPPTDSSTLDEDSIDDILFFARTNDLSELQSTLTAAASASDLSQRAVLERAVDADTGNTAVHMAAANGHVDTLKFLLPLLQESADQVGQAAVDVPNAAGNTPLHWAALNGHLDAAKALLQAGASTEVKNAAGHDPIYEAERNDKEALVALLIGWGQEDKEEGIGKGDVVEENGTGKEPSDSAEVKAVEEKTGKLELKEDGGGET